MEVIFLGNHIAPGEKNNFCIPVREDVSAGLKIHENWPNFPYHNLNTFKLTLIQQALTMPKCV